VYALGPEGASGARVKALVKRSWPDVRVMVSGPAIYPDEARLDPRQSDVDEALGTMGLRVDMSDCQTITLDGLRPQILRPLQTSLPEPPRVAGPSRYKSYLTTCHVIEDTRDQLRGMAERRAADIIFDRLEDACPQLFQGRRTESIHEGDAWLRRYPQTDLVAWVSKGNLMFMDTARNSAEFPLGSARDWAVATQAVQCGRRHSKYFANVLQSPQEPRNPPDNARVECAIMSECPRQQF
jgi:hypothetical protein